LWTWNIWSCSNPPCWMRRKNIRFFLFLKTLHLMMDLRSWRKTRFCNTKSRQVIKDKTNVANWYQRKECKESEVVWEEPNCKQVPSSILGIFWGPKASQWGGVIRIGPEKKNWLSEQALRWSTQTKFKAMDEEEDQLVRVKGPMPSWLMLIFVCNVCKFNNYIGVRKEIIILPWDLFHVREKINKERKEGEMD